MKYSTTTQIRTSAELKQAFQRLCKKKKTTPSKFLRAAMRLFTERAISYEE